VTQQYQHSTTRQQSLQAKQQPRFQQQHQQQ
jgi:hypothetical protein